MQPVCFLLLLSKQYYYEDYTHVTFKNIQLQNHRCQEHGSSSTAFQFTVNPIEIINLFFEY